MDSYAPRVERLTRQHQIEHLASMLTNNQTGSSSWRTYFATFTFDRTRSQYLTPAARCSRQACDEVRPTASNVRFGMTRAMPVAARNQAFVGDVHKWYVRLIREMFGRYRERYRVWYPRAVGFLDHPSESRPAAASAFRGTSTCTPTSS